MGFFKNKNKGPSPKLALKGLRFFSPAPRHALLIVSIDDGWMKCVCGQGHPKKRKVQFLWAEPIHGWSEEQVSTRLKVLLHEHGIAHAHILIAHASHLSRARALRLPSVNREEIKTMVDLQVEKHTPDAKEETLTYFRILEATEQGYSNVLLVMAHQDAVAHSARIAQKLSAKSIKVGSDIEGLIRWYQQFIQLEKQGREGGTLLLDIDAEHSTLMIFHGGEAYYHRTIPLKIEDLTQDSSGEVVSQFVGEVHRSLMAYEEEGLKGPCERLLLSGGVENLSDLVEKIGHELKLPATRVPFQMGYTFAESVQKYFESQSSVSFTALLGFLQGFVVGDLAPLSMRVRQTFQEKVKVASLLGTQVLTGLLLVSGFLAYQVYQDNTYRNFLLEKTDQMEKPANELELSLEHLKAVKDRLNQRGVLLEALMAAKKATPPEIQWDSLTYVQSENLIVKGTSSQMAKVFEMVTALEQLPLFAKPEVRKVNKRKVENKDVTDFELVLPFPGEE